MSPYSRMPTAWSSFNESDLESTPLASVALGEEQDTPPPARHGQSLMDFVQSHVVDEEGGRVTKHDLLKSFTEWRQREGRGLMQLWEQDRADIDAAQVLPTKAWRTTVDVGPPGREKDLYLRDVWVGYKLTYKPKSFAPSLPIERAPPTIEERVEQLEKYVRRLMQRAEGK